MVLRFAAANALTSLVFSADFCRNMSEGFTFRSNEFPGLSDDDEEENVLVFAEDVIIVACISLLDGGEDVAVEGTMGGSMRRICFGGGLELWEKCFIQFLQSKYILQLPGRHFLLITFIYH